MGRRVAPGDHGARRAAATGGHAGGGPLPAAAVEVIHRVVNDSGRLTRRWADVQIDELGDGPYAEIVGVTAIVAALDVYARAIGDRPLELLPPVDGPPSAERPDGVGDVGAWIAMTEEKALANVSRALSLVPRTNATWRALVTESYSRGPRDARADVGASPHPPADRAHRGAGLVAPGVLLLNVEPHGAAPCEQHSARDDRSTWDRPSTTASGSPTAGSSSTSPPPPIVATPTCRRPAGPSSPRVGPAGLLEACLTVGAFNGLTRVADATGIPLDGGTLAATTDVRAELGLNDMAGARSSGAAVDTSGPAVLPATVRDLFADEPAP